MKCEVHWVRSQFINHISHSLSSFVVHYSVDSCDIPLSVGLLFKQNRVVYVSIACACVCVISGVWLHMWYMQPNSWLFICWYYRMIFRYCACCCKITGAIIMYGTFSGRSHVHRSLLLVPTRMHTLVMSAHYWLMASDHTYFEGLITRIMSVMYNRSRMLLDACMRRYLLTCIDKNMLCLYLHTWVSYW